MSDAGAAAGEAVATRIFTSVLAICTFGEHDEATVRFAADIARQSRARLSVLGVRDHSSELTRIARHSQIDQHEVRKWLDAALDADTRALVERAGVSGAEIAARNGKVFLEAIREVNETGHDLVVKAAERVEGVGGYLFASTDQHLIRKCPCPVWLRVPGTPSNDRPVVAAVDADEAMASEPATQAELNDRIIALAQGIAAFTGGQLYIVTAWDAPGEALARRWFTDADRAGDYVRDVERERRAALDAIIRRAPSGAPGDRASPSPIPILRQGVARTVVTDFVTARNAAHLVMGTIARTGLTGFLIGNTAEDVLNAVTCSVLTVKPPGFVSPVR